MEWAEYYLCPQNPTCERCEKEESQFGININPDKCGQCRVPQLRLMPENVEPWKLWNILSGQQNTGYGGKCGPLMFASIQFIFGLYDVGAALAPPDKKAFRREVFEKIQLVHSVYAEKVLKDG